MYANTPFDCDGAQIRACSRQLATVVTVTGDLDDEASLTKALQGAYGAFFVTAFWEYNSVEREQAQARAMAAAAKAAGLQHAVWSTLPDTREHIPHDDDRVPTLHGSYKVPHFDAKGEANASVTALGVPTTFLQTTFYYEAFLQGQGPRRNDNGELVLTLPMADNTMALIAAEDIGKTALGVFRRGGQFIGKTVSIAGTHATGEELAATFTAALGEKVVYRPLTTDQMRASGQPIALEMANMFQFYSEASEYFTAVRDLDLVRELNPELQPLDTWLTQHKNEIPLD